jgi:hypothetical protein
VQTWHRRIRTRGDSPKSVSSSLIDRWLGKERAEHLSGIGKGWYGPPIPLLDVPGNVRLCGDGDFVGQFDRGFFYSAADAMHDWFKRISKPRYGTAYAGFASVGDVLSRDSGGFGQILNGTVSKTGPTGVVAAASSLWRLGAMPAAGSIGAAPPGGTANAKGDTGSMAFNNPASGTLRLTGADFSASVINNAVMLYDRLFSVAPNMNSTSTQSVTGVPTRFQSTDATNQDYAGGNFLFFVTGGTALAATAHNWTVCQYRDDANNDAQTLPSIAGVSGCIVDRFDMPVNTWFAPLAAGDTGLMDLAQLQLSAAVATGVAEAVIGHAVGVMAFPVINSLLPFDWITNRKLAPYIPANACLAMFELPKPATTATVYNGLIYATSTES